MSRDAYREVVAFAVLGAGTFLFISVYTFRQEDYLIGDSIRNGCGPVGAFLAQHLMLWMGKWSSYCLTVTIFLWGLCLLFRRQIPGMAWKIVGVAILILALATLEVGVMSENADLESLPGGYYGQFFHSVLFSRLNRLGSFLIIGVSVAISVVISTEIRFYPVLVRAGRIALNPEPWHSASSFMSRSIGRVRSLWPLRLPRTHGIPWRRKLRKVITEGRSERPSPTPSLKHHSIPDEEEFFGEEHEEDPSTTLTEPEDDDGTDDDTPFNLKISVTKPPKPTASKKTSAKRQAGFRLPSVQLLSLPNVSGDPTDRTTIQETAARIEETLQHFKIDARVVEVQKGPVITQYEVSLAAGIKVHKIVSLSDDLAMALKARSIRIVAPIPGKSTVGVEVPNRNRGMVGLRELVESREFRTSTQRLPLALGKDIAGIPIIYDLGQMPHLLIAGSTGSGKSVCINSIIINLLMNKSPEEVKLILMDPKMVELASFENIPHLLTPLVTDMKKAPAVLNWLVDKMDERYELLALAGVRHLTAYNALGRKVLRERFEAKLEGEALKAVPDFLPYYIVIIDELADLMMSASKEVEASITRLSQKSRAVGIHVVLATQRPSVDVITGLIKANMPCRISFHVTSKVDSRTILDRNGAEKLLGKGDMLFLPPGTSNLIRAQGTYISDREINDVVKFVRREAEPQFDNELARFGIDGASDFSEEDELYEDAVHVVLESQRGSATLLQRQLQIGYTRASRLMELMEANGLVGPFKGSKAREVYYTLDEWEASKKRKKGEAT